MKRTALALVIGMMASVGAGGRDTSANAFAMPPLPATTGYPGLIGHGRPGHGPPSSMPSDGVITVYTRTPNAQVPPTPPLARRLDA